MRPKKIPTPEEIVKTETYWNMMNRRVPLSSMDRAYPSMVLQEKPFFVFYFSMLDESYSEKEKSSENHLMQIIYRLCDIFQATKDPIVKGSCWADLAFATHIANKKELLPEGFCLEWDFLKKMKESRWVKSKEAVSP